jgi:hypothetical protein
VHFSADTFPLKRFIFEPGLLQENPAAKPLHFVSGDLASALLPNAHEDASRSFSSPNMYEVLPALNRQLGTLDAILLVGVLCQQHPFTPTAWHAYVHF